MRFNSEEEYRCYYRNKCRGDMAHLMDSSDYEFPRVQWLVSKCNGRILDVGCGTGDIAAYLSSRGFEVTAIDPSFEHARIARERYPNLKVIRGFVEDFRSLSFDTAICGDVIEHVANDREFLSSLTDVASDIFITTPLGFWDSPEHVREYSLASASMLVEPFGGTVEVIKDVFGNGRWIGLSIRRPTSNIGFERFGRPVDELQGTLGDRKECVRTAIVVPVHNAPGYVRSIIPAFAELTSPVVWVDDASSLETQELINDQRHYLRNSRQQLYSRTANRGIRYACKHFSPDYVAVVNTDCDLAPGWLDALEEIMSDNADIGIVGYDHGVEHHEDLFRRIFSPDYVTGHCLLLRVRMLEQIGVFCETDICGEHLRHTRHLWGLAHLGSDEYLSIKAMRSGWVAGYCTRSLVGHAVSASWPGKEAWLTNFDLSPLWEPFDGF